MAETQENNSKLDASITQEQVKKKFFLLIFFFEKNFFLFSVLNFKKNLNDVVKKKRLLKLNIPKHFKNLIVLIQNIWMI